MLIKDPKQLIAEVARVQKLSDSQILEELDHEAPSYTSLKTGEPLLESTLQNTRKIFTNLDKPVAAFKVGGLISGMAIAKQSRAEYDSRVIMARMIQGNPNLSETLDKLEMPDFLHQIGDGFFKSVFDEYGDDSVARDCEFAAVFEGVSQLEAMSLLHHRVLFGIEKSTRYMDYSKRRKDRNFNYYLDPSIKSAGLEIPFRSLSEEQFSLYSELINPATKTHAALDSWLREKKLPFELYEAKAQSTLANKNLENATHEELKEGYDRTIAAALKDQIRHLLPLSSRTSLGLAFNSLALRHFIYSSQSRPYLESILIGELFRREMGNLASPFLADTDIENKRAQEYLTFNFSTRKPITDLNLKRNIFDYEKPFESYEDTQLKLDVDVHEGFVRVRNKERSLDLTLSTSGTIAELVSSILCERISQITKPVAIQRAREMSETEKLARVYDSLGIAYTTVTGNLELNPDRDIRLNRRHRPSRAFESISIDTTMMMPVAEIRDLRRHTLQSYLDPLYFTPAHGFYFSEGIKAIGLESAVTRLNNSSSYLWHQINDKCGPYAASTILPMSVLAPMNTSFNLREAYHILELRTEGGAAPVYLRLAQMLYSGLKELLPDITPTMKFVNTSTETDYGRAIQEVRGIKKRKSSQVKVNLA